MVCWGRPSNTWPGKFDWNICPSNPKLCPARARKAGWVTQAESSARALLCEWSPSEGPGAATLSSDGRIRVWAGDGGTTGAASTSNQVPVVPKRRPGGALGSDVVAAKAKHGH
jgi:hypothetical protein